MRDKAFYEEKARTVAALAHPVRLAILDRLSEGPASTGSPPPELQLPHPAPSPPRPPRDPRPALRGARVDRLARRGARAPAAPRFPAPGSPQAGGGRGAGAGGGQAGL